MTEPLVLIPGMMCDARIFAPQMQALGTGRAVTVALPTGGERIEEIAANLLDQLPQRFALAGLSMGGIVAMELLRRAPRRITRIALMDTNALAETPQSATAYEPLIIKARAGRPEEALAAFMRPEYLAPGPARAEILALMADMARNLGGAAIVRQARALQRRFDQQATLRRCRVPALVLCGALDPVTPIKRHRLMAELIPGARLTVIEDAGHLPVLERPAAVTAALEEWLAQPAGGPDG